MRVLGLDVSSGFVVGCLLEAKPADPLRFYLESPDFGHFPASSEGVARLLALKPEVVVLEPTGKYSRLWRKQLEKNGCEIWMVGHRELKLYRQAFGTEEKDDELDALALACYWFDHHCSSRRFLSVRHPLSAELRETILRLGHLSRLSTPLINNLRQDLSWQFPEAAAAQSEPTDRPALLWEWLAGELNGRSGTRYDRRLENSCGIGIHLAARGTAKILCEVQRQEIEQMGILRTLLQDDKLAPYHEILDRFGFGERVRAVLLSQIFPFSQRFLENGKPINLKRKGKKSGKLTTRHISERRFLKCLGVAPSREQSGSSLNRVRMTGGSDLSRRALWQWVFTRLEVEKNRPKTAICDRLVEELLQKKASKPVKLARAHICAKAAKLLYRELVAAGL